MKFALEILQEELNKLNQPNKSDDEDDIYDAVIHMRKTTDLKLAIKYLNQIKDNTEELKKIDYLWK